MNINAREGTKIVYCNPENGMPHDQKKAEKHLILNHEYSVDYTLPGDFSSKVCLREIDGIWFNTVMFDEVKKP